MEFIKYTKKDYRTNWHHAVMCREVEDWIHGKVKRLLIVAPPRSGKSEIVSRRAPAYAFGHYPDDPMITAAYSADHAQRLSRDLQAVMDEPSYGQVFPGVGLYKSGTRNVGPAVLRTQKEFRIPGHKGVYICAGVDGGITGSGFKRGIIDDPIKGWKEAHSPTVRRNAWHWFWFDFMTRQESDASVLITMTRWHEDDIMGRLIRDVQSGLEQDWRIVHLEAIKTSPKPVHHADDPRTEGEVLWKEKTDYYEQFRRHRSLWSAAFQGRPSPDEGGKFKRAWFRYFKYADLPPFPQFKIPSGLDSVIIHEDHGWTDFVITVDCAFGKSSDSSFVVAQAWGRIGADCYLLDQERSRLEFTETIDMLVGKYNPLTRCRPSRGGFLGRWPFIAAKLVENKANGPAVMSILRKEVTGLISWNPKGSKEQRAVSVTPAFEAGNVWIPHHTETLRGVKAEAWVPDFENELVIFPNGAADDQVDACTMALIRFTNGFEVLLGRADQTDDERRLEKEAGPWIAFGSSLSGDVNNRGWT